jgi:hypothetical protein
MTRHLTSLLSVSLVLACAPPTYVGAPVQSLTTPVTSGQKYFSAPWPDDRRLAADGSLSTDGFPNPYGQGTFTENLLMTGNGLVHGWGTSAPAFMPFSGAIDPSSLPTSSSSGTPSVFILNIDPKSPDLGKRAVADFHYYADATGFMPANVLAVRPTPGFPLRPKTKYAVVVTTSVKDANGHPVGPQQAFWDVFVGKPSGAAEQAAATYYAPLISELKREHVSLASIAGATVFTTQAIYDEMETLRDYLLSLPLPAFDPGTLQYDANYSVPAKGNIPGYYVFEATYPATNMQHGTPPFELSGGDFQYDSTGHPTPGYMEHLNVSIVVPTTPAPPGGWPVVMYSHGTGGNYLSVIQEYEAVGPTIAQQGLVAFGINQILTGPRSGLSASAQPTGCFEMPVENCFIDPVNAVAGRNNLRQSALDNVTLRQLISNPATVIPAAATSATVAGFTNPVGEPITFNSQKIGFIGHSQGGLTGCLYVPLDPATLGGVISGAGGLLTATIIERSNPMLLPLVQGPLLLNLPAGETLDWYHPVLALIQTLAEAVDPINWGRTWVTEPLPGGRPKNVFTTSGLLDQDTPTQTAEFLNTAALIPQLLPLVQGHDALSYDVAGIKPVSTPLSGNVTSGGTTVTAAFHQWPAPERHFVIFDDREARHQWSTFLKSTVIDGLGSLPEDCSSCTCADGTCADSSGDCDDGTNCSLCSVCECFEYGGNTCPMNAQGDCGNGYGNCMACNTCFCDDDTCPIDAQGNCHDGTNCLPPTAESVMQ